MPVWLEKFLPILLLLVAIGIVVSRLPKVDLGHSEAYKRRRIMNWVPLGLTYAFLYFGRYNLSAIADMLDKQGLLTKTQFGDIDGVGAATYGIAFLLNGPLTDRWGGRTTILIAAAGSALMNVGMALTMTMGIDKQLDADQVRNALLVLNALNMYFQSFGAVSIVKVNAPWFHVRERGVLGGMFGILISLGLYFAYDWSLGLAERYGVPVAFWGPAAVLGLFTAIAAALVRDTPSAAGFKDFDTGDATSGQTGQMPLAEVVRRMFSQRIIWIIVAIEFCSGFMRQAVMKWFRSFARAINEHQDGGMLHFVYDNWGMLLCVAGILGGVFAGFISDHLFQSRRGPVASVLYGGLLAGSVAAAFSLGTPMLGWAMIFLSLCVIGVHGMLSGTASMDFGGSKNAGVVTGIIDGFVYFGGATQAFYYGRLLPKKPLDADVANWIAWPASMIPVALVGLLLALTLWNAKPSKGGGH